MAHINKKFTFTVNDEQFAALQQQDRVLSAINDWLKVGLPKKFELLDEELLYMAKHFQLISIKNGIHHMEFSNNSNFDEIFGEKFKKLVPFSLKRDII